LTIESSLKKSSVENRLTGSNSGSAVVGKLVSIRLRGFCNEKNNNSIIKRPGYVERNFAPR
jgi:hypothetical protein